MGNIRQLQLGLLLIFLLSACDKTAQSTQYTEEGKDKPSESSEEVQTGKGDVEALAKTNLSDESLSESKVKAGVEIGIGGEIKSRVKKDQSKITFETIQWTDLIPKEDLDALLNPPEYLAEIEDGSEEDQLTSQLKADNNAKNDRYQQALNSKTIRPEYNARHVRIPGFIVPLEFDDHETITTFFLVPFFGACLHLPPPPPNQIIYAEYEPGIRLEALYDPFWISGKLFTSLIENDVAVAAYSMSVSSFEIYTEEDDAAYGRD